MLKATPLVRIDERGARNDQDLVAIEAPLAIRAADADGPVDLGLYLRTPGDDFALAVGMLYSEGLIDAAADIASHTIAVDADEVSASILLQLAPERRIDRDAPYLAGGVSGARWSANFALIRAVCARQWALCKERFRCLRCADGAGWPVQRLIRAIMLGRCR